MPVGPDQYPGDAHSAELLKRLEEHTDGLITRTPFLRNEKLLLVDDIIESVNCSRQDIEALLPFLKKDYIGAGWRAVSLATRPDGSTDAREEANYALYLIFER